MKDKIDKLGNTTLLKNFFEMRKSEEQTKSNIKNIFIGCTLTALITLLGSWLVWITTQTLEVEDNKKEIIELKERIKINEEKFIKFREEFLSQPNKKQSN